MTHIRHAPTLVDGKDLAAFAGLLADATRATICLALLDGRDWTLSELAEQAGVRPPTASEHVSKLVAAGLLAETRRGRHRHVRLSGPDTARLLEALATRAHRSEPPRSLRAQRASAALQQGRTCYDHLAGRLGVEVLDGLLERGLADDRDGLALTPAGREWLRELGADPATRTGSGRPLVRACLDWTERRPHLAGAAGAALLDAALARAWIERDTGSRAVRLTPAGRAGFEEHLGLRL